jgi:hypothetical protein
MGCHWDDSPDQLNYLTNHDQINGVNAEDADDSAGDGKDSEQV